MRLAGGFCIILLCFIAACGPGRKAQTTPDAPVTVPSVDPDVVYDLYSVIVQSNLLRLLEMEDRTRLLLGNYTLRESTTAVNSLANSGDDIFVKWLLYPGIELNLFAPVEDTTAFLIYNMVISSPDYATARGVRVGDERQKVLSVYPELPKEYNRSVQIDDENYRMSLYFIFSDNERLREIELIYQLQP